VRNTLVDFRRRAEELGAERTLLVATSAVRDAENGEAFLGEIEWSYGFDTELLSGEDEARLTFRGVTSGRALDSETLILDIGGGSTELVDGRGRDIRFHASLDLGCVRLTERFLHADPPRPAELATCSEEVRSLLAEHVPDDLRPTIAIGVGGTITTMAALDLRLAEYDSDLVNGRRLPAAVVDRQLIELASLPLAERRGLPGLEPERAPVIVAGVVIAREVLAHFDLDELEVTEWDLLRGAVLAAAELPQPQEGDAPPGAFTCC
jgi:exopolyphosphatase/guanosine-5'-triphosphate,3'-diphosphate pyrophosphatase